MLSDVRRCATDEWQHQHAECKPDASSQACLASVSKQVLDVVTSACTAMSSWLTQQWRSAVVLEAMAPNPLATKLQ